MTKRPGILPQHYHHYNAHENYRDTMWTLQCSDFSYFRFQWKPILWRKTAHYEQRRGWYLRWGYWSFAILGRFTPREDPV